MSLGDIGLQPPIMESLHLGGRTLTWCLFTPPSSYMNLDMWVFYILNIKSSIIIARSFQRGSPFLPHTFVCGISAGFPISLLTCASLQQMPVAMVMNSPTSFLTPKGSKGWIPPDFPSDNPSSALLYFLVVPLTFSREPSLQPGIGIW